MDFYSEIEQRGLGHLLKEVPIHFKNFIILIKCIKF